mgnify:CR=1 FL=1
MLHDIDLILTLTGGLTAALALGFITQKLKLSPIVGYLLAGVIVGPFTPGFVADQGLANELAEIGEQRVVGVGPEVEPIAVAPAKEQVGPAQFLHLGLERAEGEPALAREFAQVQFAIGCGEE